MTNQNRSLLACRNNETSDCVLFIIENADMKIEQLKPGGRFDPGPAGECKVSEEGATTTIHERQGNHTVSGCCHSFALSSLPPSLHASPCQVEGICASYVVFLCLRIL